MPKIFFKQAKRMLLQIKAGDKHAPLKFKQIVEKNKVHINEFDEANGHSLLIEAIDLTASAHYERGIVLLECIQLLLEIPGINVLHQDSASKMATHHFAELRSILENNIRTKRIDLCAPYLDLFVKSCDKTQECFCKAVFINMRELAGDDCDDRTINLFYNEDTGDLTLSRLEELSSEKAEAIALAKARSSLLSTSAPFIPPTHPPRHLRAYDKIIQWTAIPSELMDTVINIELVISAYEMDQLTTWKLYNKAEISVKLEDTGTKFRLYFSTIPWALLDAPDTTSKVCPCLKYCARIKQIRQETAHTMEPMLFSPSSFFEKTAKKSKDSAATAVALTPAAGAGTGATELKSSVKGLRK